MSTYPQFDPRIQRQEDETQLRYLAIANYAYAAFNAVGVLVGAALLLFVSGIITVNRANIDPEAIPILGLVGGAFGFLVVLIPLVATILHFAFARALQTERFYVFCVIMAIWTCLSVPIGTVIGILTMVVLMRPSVQRIFDERKREVDEQTIAASQQHPNHGTV